jgi:16S rRNA (cytosine967-C5)-methyltransferase
MREPRRPPPEEQPADAQPGGARDPRLGRIHDRVLEAAAQIETGIPADRALAGVFRRARDLGGRERAMVSETVYGLIRAARRVDDRLARALKAEKKRIDLIEKPILLRMRVLAFLAMKGDELTRIEALDPYAYKRVPNFLERIRDNRLPPVTRSEAEDLAVEVSLPDWMIRRLIAHEGLERTREIGRALELRAPVTLRVNTIRVSREDARLNIERTHGILASPTAVSSLGLILPEHADLQSWDLYQKGAVELQDEGSQLVGLATGASPGQVVLDACAGAGGKTIQLAAMMENKGRLIALDPDAKKLEELKRRARRAGITNTETLATDLEALPKRLLGACDRVLVDAPCTGSGVFRRHPDAKWRLEERDLESHVDRQARLITSAAGALKAGGLLVYATCSVLFEENEAIVEAALAADPRLERTSLVRTWGPDLAARLGAGAHTARIGPGPTERDPDGFFVALMSRTS